MVLILHVPGREVCVALTLPHRWDLEVVLLLVFAYSRVLEELQEGPEVDRGRRSIGGSENGFERRESSLHRGIDDLDFASDGE